MANAANVHSSAGSTGELYVTGTRTPLKEEVTAFDLDVIGRIPEALNGRFTRMGPNPVGAFDAARLKSHHYFHGSGMVHGVRLRDGKAEWFRSRRVVDPIVVETLGVEPIPGPGEGVRDGNVNTNVIQIAGTLYATIEAGNLPVELNGELESVRRWDFDGGLEAGFSAHAREDPATGEHRMLTYEANQPVRYVSVSRDGRATTRARIDLPHGPMIHDTAFTSGFIVVPDFPVTLQPHYAHTDFPWLWDETRPSRIGLLPIDGDVARMQWFEAPRCFAFHFVNAYDDGDVTIIDLPKHPSMFRTDQNGPNEGAPTLVRWSLNRATGRLTETVLDDHGCDFPRINDTRGGREYRYAYTAHWGDRLRQGPAFKHDVELGRTETHDYGPGCMTSEPVFVAKPGARAEDEGWVISSVYDPERDRSDIVILDAQDFSADPVAIIRLPTRIPFTFHGGWAPDATAA